LYAVTVADNTDSNYPSTYGAIHERDAEHPRSSIRGNSNILDSEHRQWDLNYREAALYLKVDCLTPLYGL